MKIINENKAFTLIELIVTITILAILSTIAFINFQGFSRDARDSARISDLKNIRKVLELYSIENSNYPEVTNGISITYSGSEVWKQGIFGQETRVLLGNKGQISEVPLDPLTQTPYTYSLLNTKRQYQLGGIMEGEIISSVNLINTTYADNGNDAKAYVIGNYNGIASKTTQCILALPSIITNDTTNTDLSNIFSSGSLIYKGFKNLPSSYSGTTLNIRGEDNLKLMNKLEVYCGNLNDLGGDNITERGKMLDSLQNAYSGTIIENQSEIGNILTDDGNKEEEIAVSIVNNIVGGSATIQTSCKTQPTYEGATFSIGTPVLSNQDWQGIDSTKACYYTCGTGKVLLNGVCINENCSGVTPDGTTKLSNANSTVGGTWNYSTSPGTCTYSCADGYHTIDNGQTCIIDDCTLDDNWSEFDNCNLE